MEILVNEVIRARDEQDLYTRCLNEIYAQYQPNHCLVAEYHRDQGIAQTLTYLCNGALANNFSYDLKNTPCENVITHSRLCSYSANIQQHFPDDIALKDLQAESYIGIPLQAQDGSIVGVIALLFDAPLHIEKFDQTWLLTMGFLIGKTIIQQRLTKEKERLLRQFERSEQITKSCSWEWDVASDRFYCSQNLAVMFGIDDARTLTFDDFFSHYVFVSPERYKQFIASATAQLGVSKIIVDKAHSRCRQALELTFYRDYDESGRLVCIEGNIKNINDFSQLESNHLIAQKIIELSNNGVIVTDEDNRILHMNAQAEQITGYSLREVFGRSPGIFRSDIHDNSFYLKMWKKLSQNDYWSGEVWNQTKTGVVYPEFLSISTVRDNNRMVKNYIGIFEDISDRKLLEKELKQYKNEQDFVGLYTRTQFVEYFEKHSNLIVILVDINRFSAINNLHGEAFGNKVLRYVGILLYRHFCGNGVNVCRYAADQFALSCPTMDVEKVDVLVDEIRDKLERQFYISGQQMTLNVNIGYALPSSAASGIHLMAQAYYALSSAKSLLSPSTVRYSEYLEKHIGRKYRLGVELKRAIDAKQLHVEYQPIYDLESKRVVKFEALARWTRNGEAVSPFEFIPIAEELGYINQLGNLVLSIACRDLKLLRDRGHDEIQMSVNRSIQELTNESIEDCSILKIILESGLSTSDIVLEITESIPLEDKPEVQELLGDLRRKGLKLALDDFGTGFASFSNLMKNTVDILKIDRTFIRDIESDKNNAVLVQSVNMLATGLGLDVIAEGVETEGQLKRLQAMGCKFIQGYYISHPVVFEQTLAFLE